MKISDRKMKRVLSVFLAFVVLFSVCFDSVATAYAANDGKEHIRTFDELLQFAADSQKNDFKGKTVLLEDDIEIGVIEQGKLDNYGIKHLTIGNKNNSFKGVFDGQGHTIRGLKYDQNILPDANSGLFCCTENATVKNLIVEEANLDCIYQGGVVVGHAVNTTFENVTVLNCDMRIDTGNNVVSLFTNGGFSGGGIVGILKDSRMYNCEASGTKVHNNVTVGVTGIGGEGMYMGGLVGWASNSTIEYCRARSNYSGEGNSKTVRKTVVKNKYDIAIGALGGKVLYAGGIAGGVNNGTNFIDCFSTADVYFYAATYVSVGAGIAGYGGGITGALRGASSIIRCHYAGNIHSRQYNAVLIIPIIQDNVNICGLTMKNESGNKIENSYFRQSDIESGKVIPAVGGMNDNASYSGQNDSNYINRSFWEERGYDFSGRKERNTSGKEGPHYNKWVMDYESGIPVHGNSVSAAFDFPNAGNVTIGKTDLVNKEVTSKNACAFAVQGLHTDKKNRCNIGITLNEGYNFKAWHKTENFFEKTAKDIEELQNFTKSKDNVVGVVPDITLDVKDNDLYVAEVTANVVFHDLNGKEIKKEEFAYNSVLGECGLSSVPEKGKFYGWTTISNAGKGYDNITSSQINDIKAKGELYKNGDAVTKPMQLYPVFINSVSNTTVIFEGHEQDSENNTQRRVDIGYAEINSDEKGAYIEAAGYGNNKSFPAGYKFKGWYKSMDLKNDYVTDSQKKKAEVCVSKDPRYYLPDITDKVTYIARFEYKVSYWTKAFQQDKGHFVDKSQLCATIMHDYKEKFNNITGPGYSTESTVGWGYKHIYHKQLAECNDTYKNKLIVEPIDAYAHNYADTDNVLNNYGVMGDTDFPNSGKTSVKWIHDNHFDIVYTSNDNERYFFNFWTLENNRNGRWTYKKSTSDIGPLWSLSTYKARAMAYTKLYFHMKDNTITKCDRRYNDNILLNKDISFTYKYHFYSNHEVNQNTYDGANINKTFVSQASPQNMDYGNYVFLGWISDADVSKDSYEWNYIYDLDEQYCTSDLDKVRPYLVTESDKVYEKQDLYPVYAKYDIEVTNNIKIASLDSAKYGCPKDPQWKLIPDSKEKGKATIEIIAETNSTPVLNNNPDGAKYKYDSISYEENGVSAKLNNTVSVNENEIIYKGKVVAGKHLRYIVNYKPLILKFHCSANQLKFEIRNKGDQLNSSVEPDYDKISGIENTHFIGWTENKPENGMCIVTKNKDEALNMITPNDEVIERNMEFWPVFAGVKIKVNSNLDGNIVDPDTIRSMKLIGTEKVQLWAKDLEKYSFSGWYTGFKSNDNMGRFISSDRNYIVKGNDLYQDVTYTAVYKKSVTVTYHGKDGEPIYIVKVPENTRSFVKEIAMEDGVKETFIDIEATNKLNFSKDNSNIFIEWQWNNGDKMIQWNDFYNKPIKDNMDIYPKYASIKMEDSNHQDYTSNMILGYISEDKNKPDKKTIGSVFKNDYNQSDISYVIKETSWNPALKTMRTIPCKDIPTRVYYNKLDAESNEAVYIEASKGPIITDNNGVAFHKLIKEKVKLKIKKIWKGDNEAERPQKITLNISRSYRDDRGKVIKDNDFGKIVVLTKENCLPENSNIWEKELEEKFDTFIVKNGKAYFYVYDIKEEGVKEYKTIVKYPRKVNDENEYHYYIEIYNVKGVFTILPNTGGTGTYILYGLGIILIMVVILDFILKKRKHKQI